MATPIPDKTVDEILRAFGIAPPDDAAHYPGSGVRASLGGHKREDGQKVITLTIVNVSESRVCPLANGQAKSMVARFCTNGLLPHKPALESMVEHLLQKAAALYDGDPIESFVLEDLRLHEGGYRIGSVKMFRTKNCPASKAAHLSPIEALRSSKR